ncbi:MAG: hypothetical protein QM803_18840 [Rhodocyclaceae bacterium]
MERRELIWRLIAARLEELGSDVEGDPTNQDIERWMVEVSDAVEVRIAELIPRVGARRVICEMPNNTHDCPQSAARQCVACGRYFCRKHPIQACPVCGGAVQ